MGDQEWIDTEVFLRITDRRQRKPEERPTYKVEEGNFQGYF
jgi:hypothetical protein